jgi:hypothetical protein
VLRRALEIVVRLWSDCFTTNLEKELVSGDRKAVQNLHETPGSQSSNSKKERSISSGSSA